MNLTQSNYLNHIKNLELFYRLHIHLFLPRKAFHCCHASYQQLVYNLQFFLNASKSQVSSYSEEVSVSSFVSDHVFLKFLLGCMHITYTSLLSDAIL